MCLRCYTYVDTLRRYTLLETVSSINAIERNIPFHELGVQTEGLLTARECMEKAGLNWQVELMPCYAQLPNGSFIEVKGNKIPVRTDENIPFKAVGNRYHPFQNKDAFNFLDNIVDDFGATYDSAGAFDNGAIVYIMLKLSDDIVIGDDKVVPYLTLVNSHNGTTSLKAFTTPIRIVCSNTLRLAMQNAVSSFSFKHTQNAGTKISQARKSLQLGFAYYGEMQEELDKLIDVQVKKDEVQKMLDLILPVVERTDIEGNVLNEGVVSKQKLAHTKILNNFDNADSPSTVGNAWGLLNAVNSWELWEKEMRNTDRAERQAKGMIQNRVHPVSDKAFDYIKRELLV